MKKLYITISILFIQFAAYAQVGGDLGPTFGTNGVHTLDFSHSVRAQDLKVAPNGKIVYAGYTNVGIPNMVVVQLNADGTLDASFANNGIGIYDPSLGGNNALEGVAVQPDGKILVTGRVIVNLNSTVFVGRLLPDGSFDPSFGGGIGYVQYPGFSGEKIKIDNNGKIVVMGYVVINGKGHTLLYRLHANGTPDNTFSGDGYLDFHLPEDAQINGNEYNFSIATDNSIYIAGKDNAGRAVVCKVTSNGVLDNSFSGNGKLSISHPFGGTLSGADVFCNNDDSFFLLCTATYNNEGSIQVTKFNANGIADNNFGNQVSASVTFPTGINITSSSILVTQGGIYVAGNSYDNGTYKAFTVNFTNSGNINTNYGENGVSYFSAALNGALGSNTIDRQPDGKIIVGGSGNVINDHYSWVVRIHSVGNMSITEEEVTSSSIYPNPTSSFFQIKLNESNAVGRISLINTVGKVLATWDGQTVYALPEGLSNGTYFVQIENDKKISKHVLIINR